MIGGAAMGTVAWIRHPEARQEGLVEFKAMLIAAGIHSMLLCFEVLVCFKVTSLFVCLFVNFPFQVEIGYMEGLEFGWLMTFMPLFVLCPLAVGACIWGFKHDRSLEVRPLFSPLSDHYLTPLSASRWRL